MGLIQSLKGSYFLRSGIYSFGQRFSTLFFGFGTFYLLVRAYSKDDHGIWVIYFTTATIVEMARNGLMQNALIKFFLSSEERERPFIQTASIVLNTCFSLLIFPVVLGIGYLLGDGTNANVLLKMFTFYGIHLVLMIPFSHLMFIQMANMNFKGIFYAAFFRQGIFFVIVVVIFYGMRGEEVTLSALVLWQALALSVGLTVSYLFGKSYLKTSNILDKKWLGQLFHFGKYAMGTNVSSMIFKATDQYMLAAILTPGATSLYNAALRVTNLVEYPSTSIVDVVFPKSVEKVKKEGLQAGRKVYEKSVGLILAIIIPLVIGVVIFSEQIMLIVAGPEYAESGRILKVIILLGLITPFNRQFGGIMDAIGKPKLNFQLLLTTTVVNILTNAVFIYYFGIIGAAYGTLSSYVFNFVINQYLLNKILGVRTYRPFIHMFTFYGNAISLIRRKSHKMTAK